MLLFANLGELVTHVNGRWLPIKEIAIAKDKDQILYPNLRNVIERPPKQYLEEADSSRLVRIYVEDWLMAKVLEDKEAVYYPQPRKNY